VNYPFKKLHVLARGLILGFGLVKGKSRVIMRNLELLHVTHVTMKLWNRVQPKIQYTKFSQKIKY